MPETLQRAITAIRSGDNETGQRLLAEVIRNEPRNEAAWLWMSSVIDSDEHRRYCLERVLAINPHSETARRGLETLKQKQATEALRPEKQPEPTPPPSTDALLQIRKIEQEATKKCPFCAETIKAEAVVCRFCGRDLRAEQPIKQPSKPSPQAPKKKRRKSNVPILVGLIFLACLACFITGRIAQSIPGIGSKPTATPSGPTLTPTPEPTLSPTDRVRVAIGKSLGSGNRDVKRFSGFSMGTGPDAEVSINWSINDNLTERLIKSGARLDVLDILEAVDKSGVQYGSVYLQGTFSMIDDFGNAKETVVVEAEYSRTTIRRINWDTIDPDNVYDIADTVWVHPAFW